MLEGTNLEKIVDPQLGILFGYGWAADVADFIRDHPKAYLSRDEGDLQEWTFPGDVLFCGLPISLHFLFSLDSLITVEMQFAEADFDSADVELLVQTLSSWFTEEFESPDEGILMVEEETTRMTFDLLDKRLVFEDVDV